WAPAGVGWRRAAPPQRAPATRAASLRVADRRRSRFNSIPSGVRVGPPVHSERADPVYASRSPRGCAPAPGGAAHPGPYPDPLAPLAPLAPVAPLAPLAPLAPVAPPTPVAPIAPPGPRASSTATTVGDCPVSQVHCTGGPQAKMARPMTLP